MTIKQGNLASLESRRLSISVAMCTYNGDQFLREQLQSIASQTVPPDELVICDDGSRDSTVNIVEAFLTRVPFGVRLFANEKNLGSSKNFEKAIRLCRGDLIALCDQDDVWHDDKLESLSNAFEADPLLGGVFSDGGFIDDASQPQPGSLWQSVRLRPSTVRDPVNFVHALLRGDSVTGATLMLRASCREVLLPIADPWVHDGWITWMLLLHSKIAAVDKKLIRYRIHRRQQLGMANVGVFGRLGAGRENPDHLRHVAREFEVLLEHYLGSGEKRFPWLETKLREKIDHFRRRSELPTARLKRIVPVLRQWASYGRYSSIRGNMIRDLLWR